MGVISWIILGLIAGWLAGFFVNKPGSGIWMNIALGIVGAVVGGWLLNLFGGTGVTGFRHRQH